MYNDAKNSKKIINHVSVDNQSSGTSNMGLDANAMDKANKYFPIYFRRFLNRTFPVICKVTDIIPGEKKKDKYYSKPTTPNFMP